MYKAETIEAIKVMQAYVDGHDINGIHGRADAPCWDWTSKGLSSYEIVKEPIEIWCMVNSNGHCLSNQATEDDCIATRDELNKQHNNDFEDYRAVKFRQVIDD